ncbi:MAG: hypothetical protein ACYTBJ_18310 [Planctomycetota bacterium]|jgi:hypothetical protein
MNGKTMDIIPDALERFYRENNIRSDQRAAEMLGFSQNNIWRWKQSGTKISFECAFELLTKLGWDFERARPGYRPETELLAADPIARYVPRNKSERTAFARAIAAARLDAVQREETLSRYEIQPDARLDPLPDAAFRGLDGAAEAFPLWRATVGPTRLLHRQIDEEGFHLQETFIVRSLTRDTPLYNRAQIVARHPETRSEMFCELRALVQRGAAPGWICAPVGLRPRDDAPCFVWSAAITTGLVVAALSAPPVPVSLLDSAKTPQQ